MRIRLTLKPGQRGTKHLVEEYGDRLVCVRYRYDLRRHKRYKTVELIVAESNWHIAPDMVVGVQVAYEEVVVRNQIKAAGGWWNAARQVLGLPYAQVEALGLTGRLVWDEEKSE